MSDDYSYTDDDYSYTDDDGDTVEVESSALQGRSWVKTSGPGVYIPQAKIPEFCRAVYKSAGLEAPELPDLPDPAMVQKLADALEALACGTGFRSSERHTVALKLVSDGWEAK